MIIFVAEITLSSKFKVSSGKRLPRKFKVGKPNLSELATEMFAKLYKIAYNYVYLNLISVTPTVPTFNNSLYQTHCPFTEKSTSEYGLRIAILGAERYKEQTGHKHKHAG